MVGAIPCVLALAVRSLPDAETIAARHEAGLARIHAIRAVVESRYSLDDGKSWATIGRYTVRRRGAREWVRVRFDRSRTGDTFLKRRGYVEYYSDPSGHLGLNGLDPDDPPPDPYDPIERKLDDLESIVGKIEPPQPFPRCGYIDTWQGIALLVPDFVVTFKELCRSSGSPRPTEERDRLGRTVYTLDLAAPGNAGRCRVSVDSSRHYAVTAVRRTDAKGKVPDFLGDLMVEEFQEPKPGIFLPKSIRGGSGPGTLYAIDVSDVAVNEPIDDGDLAFRFPAGAAVVDATKDNLIYIWGDGAPRLTFKNANEYNTWYKREPNAAFRRRRPPWWRSGAIPLVLSTLALVAVLAVGRRMRMR